MGLIVRSYNYIYILYKSTHCSVYMWKTHTWKKSFDDLQHEVGLLTNLVFTLLNVVFCHLPVLSLHFRQGYWLSYLLGHSCRDVVQCQYLMGQVGCRRVLSSCLSVKEVLLLWLTYRSQKSFYPLNILISHTPTYTLFMDLLIRIVSFPFI